MKKSPFIEALRIGVKNINSSVTLDDIIENIKKDFPQLVENRQKRMFATWFFLKFDVESDYTAVNRFIKSGDRNALLKYSNIPVHINRSG